MPDLTITLCARFSDLSTRHGLQYTRNPGYAAFALTYLGVSLLAGARWPLILLPGVLVLLDWGVIRREERYLEERFGSDYTEYRRRVRRWI